MRIERALAEMYIQYVYTRKVVSGLQSSGTVTTTGLSPVSSRYLSGHTTRLLAADSTFYNLNLTPLTSCSRKLSSSSRARMVKSGSPAVGPRRTHRYSPPG